MTASGITLVAAPAIVRTKVDPPADVILDTSLGQSGKIVITTNSNGVNDYAMDQTAGLLVSTNLFFSFLQFSLATGESATFNGPSTVQNVIARVTGGNPSTIDGAINVNIPGANFFLMNPAGVIFTANATLGLAPGSFMGSLTVTTADYLKLADGKRFTALPSAYDTSLSTAAVSAFGFLPGKPGPPSPITFSGSILTTLQGMNIIVVGGNETIEDGAALSAPAGQFILVSVAGPGEVPAIPAVLTATPLTSLPALGTINIQNLAEVSVGASGTSESGHIEIDAATVNLSNTGVIDATMLDIPSGSGNTASSILVRCQTLLLNDSGQILAQADGFGMAGTINIQAQSVSLLDVSEIDTINVGQSVGGSISVAANTLNIVGSSIVTSANGSGAAGNINVTANNISIAGSSSFQASGILAESGFTGSGGQVYTGRSGDINVTTQQLTLTGGGEISTTTFGPGQGGNVSVAATNINISGYSSFTLAPNTYVFQSGILASSQLPGNQGAGGQGGDVTISTNSLSISNNGLITASTVGSGGSGDVTINAGSGAIALDGTGATLPTGIAATTSYQTGGKGGDIAITAGSLQVLGGAEVTAATAGTGAGGNIYVTGGNLLVSGAGSIISAQTTGTQGGAGGGLRFNVVSVSVMDGGQISASTQGSGEGGSITISANQVTVDGSGASIVADTSGMNAMVTNGPSINNVTVSLTIQTTLDSRLQVILSDPGGYSVGNYVTLLSKGDATGTNLSNTTFSDSGTIPITSGTAPYMGTFQPAIPLADLNSGTANGTWELGVTKTGPGAATIEAATLMVNGQEIASSNLPYSFLHGTFYVPFTVTLPVTETPVKAGAGGSIQINAGTISLSNGGTITASTHGDGAAGSLAVQANSITIDGSHATSDTGFFASAEAGSTGAGGSISISAKELQITGTGNSGIDGGIVALSETVAPAGDITVQTGNLLLNADGVISSANLGTGPAGSVNITASNSITLQSGSLITVVAQGATAGTISLTAGQNVELFGGSTITAAAALGGGNITITTGGEFYLDGSSVIATAGLGAGGNITIDPEFIILDHSLISANAAAGAGGNIQIEGQYFFDNDTPITATGTTAGTVQITTLPLDIVNALADLQGGFIDLSAALQESCTMRLGADASSFLVIGRGGVEDSPDDPQEDLVARLKHKVKPKAGAR